MYTLLYGICVYIVRSHRGEVSHKAYSFTEYEIFTVCSRRGENSQGVFLRTMYTLCVVTGVSSLTTEDCSLWKIYTPCVVTGREFAGYIRFLRNVCTSCVVKGVSSFTRIIPLRNVHTPYVVKRARIRRAYSYTEYKRCV